MPLPQTGITPQTYESLIMDAGVVIVNYGEPSQRVLGATNGGVTFSWRELEWRSPEIDGLKGPLAGASRITRAVPQIVANLVEWNLENLMLAMPGFTEVNDPPAGFTRLERSTRVVSIDDYPVNVAVVGRLSNSNAAVIIVINRPLVMDAVELNMQQNTEATSAVTFVGHYDTSNPELEPVYVLWPDSLTAVPNLAGLTIPADSEIADDASPGDVVAAITGLTSGSTRATTNPMFAVSGGNLVVGTATLVAGVYTFQIVESLAGSQNSPRASTVTVEITA
jgi:hypothetical protein